MILTAILLLTHICVIIIVEYSSIVVGFFGQTPVHRCSKLDTVLEKFYDQTSFRKLTTSAFFWCTARLKRSIFV